MRFKSLKRNWFLLCRSLRFAWQWLIRKEHFSNRQLWSLDETLAIYALPRLREFRKVTCSYPGRDEVQSYEDWMATLDKMIFAMNYILNEKYGGYSKERADRAVEGFELFGKFFMDLWD